jgi:hypothetical protein
MRKCSTSALMETRRSLARTLARPVPVIHVVWPMVACDAEPYLREIIVQADYGLVAVLAMNRPSRSATRRSSFARPKRFS